MRQAVGSLPVVVVLFLSIADEAAAQHVMDRYPSVQQQPAVVDLATDPDGTTGPCSSETTIDYVEPANTLAAAFYFPWFEETSG